MRRYGYCKRIQDVALLQWNRAHKATYFGTSSVLIYSQTATIRRTRTAATTAQIPTSTTTTTAHGKTATCRIHKRMRWLDSRPTSTAAVGRRTSSSLSPPPPRHLKDLKPMALITIRRPRSLRCRQKKTALVAVVRRRVRRDLGSLDVDEDHWPSVGRFRLSTAERRS